MSENLSFRQTRSAPAGVPCPGLTYPEVQTAGTEVGNKMSLTFRHANRHTLLY